MSMAKSLRIGPGFPIGKELTAILDFRSRPVTKNGQTLMVSEIRQVYRLGARFVRIRLGAGPMVQARGDPGRGV